MYSTIEDVEGGNVQGEGFFDWDWSVVTFSTNLLAISGSMLIFLMRTKTKNPELWRKINFLQEDNSETFSDKKIWTDIEEYIVEKLNISNLSKSEITRLSGIKVIFPCIFPKINPNDLTF